MSNNNRINPDLLNAIIKDVAKDWTPKQSKDEFNTRMNALNQRVQKRIANELVEMFPGTVEIKSLRVPVNEFFGKVHKLFLDELMNEGLDKDDLMWALAFCHTKILVDQIL